MAPGPGLFRIAFTLLIMVTAFSLAYEAVRLGIANLQTFPVEQAIQRLQNPEATPGEKEELLQRALIQLKEAISWNPNDADAWLRLGSLHFFAARLRREDAAAFTAALEEAIAAYEVAARQRPTWAYTWIKLARAKAALGRGRWSEAIVDLDRAMVLGPWERGVQQSSIRLGFQLWEALGPKMREDVLTMVGRVLTYDPAWALRQTRRGGRGVEVLGLIQHDAALIKQFRRHVGPPEMFSSALSPRP